MEAAREREGGGRQEANGDFNPEQEVDGEQRAPYFPEDKEALMNLNECPPGMLP